MTKDSNQGHGCCCGREPETESGNAGQPMTESTPGPALIEEGFDGATHGGGQLESVPGFNVARAMIDQIGTTESSPFPPNASNMLDAGRAHYDTRPTVETQESVCGQDDRTQITTVTLPPWRMTAQLFITADNGSQYVGTAWFIAPTILLTAGHCVHSTRSGGWARSIEVVPAMNGRNRPFGSAISTTFRTVPEWFNDQSAADDYGCIILPDSQPLGEKTGWFGFASFGDAKLQNSLINTSGYPADKSVGTQWFNAGRLSRTDPDRLYYLADTFGGQSGSAVWHNDAETGKRYAVGIHNYGGCDNKATRITDKVFDVLKTWKAMGI